MNIVIVVLVILLLMSGKTSNYAPPGVIVPPVEGSGRCDRELPSVRAGWEALGYTYATLPWPARVAFAIRFGKCPGFDNW